MILQSLAISQFRNYETAAFTFSSDTTVVIGPNTSGKSNMLEAINLLATGKSFRADTDTQMIRFEEDIARVKGKTSEEEVLEVLVAIGAAAGGKAYLKKYLVNDISKRRSDFAGRLPALLFVPADLDIIVGSPGLRRRFLDDMLEQIDGEYRHSFSLYVKGLRQRNALLERTRETGVRSEREFGYWDELLITHGTIIHEKRKAFLDFANATEKDIFNFTLFYDHSIISAERLIKYHDAEIGSAVTLVGPHRDDFGVVMQTGKDIKYFGSRGQQRLVILQLKLMQLTYMAKILGDRPLLLLDDIFSELDEGHINLVSEIISKQQTIVTTTHEEFLMSGDLKSKRRIDLREKEQFSFL